VTSRAQWAPQFLAVIPGVLSYPEGIVAVVAWIDSEGSHARCNPLDTERPWPGATDYNPAGVKNYLTQEDGIRASLATIMDGFYGGILAALRARASADAVCAEVCASRWGSQPTPPLLADVRTHWAFTSSIQVAGTAQTPIPTPVDTGKHYDALVPGPAGLEFAVIGQMTGPGGLYRGRQVSGGAPVWAGTGNPTTWAQGFDVKSLLSGTPLAVALADAPKTSTVVSTVIL
jgi:hypothetical protein